MKHKLFTLFVLLALLIAFLPAQPARADSIITVNSTADNTTTDGACTLREAITNANADSDTTGGDCAAGSGFDAIVFDGSLGTATITLVSELPAITDGAGLTIDGDNRITLSGNDSVQVLYVNAGASGGGFTLQNISVTHGSADSGAGLYNANGKVTISHSVFSNNNATGSGGGAINAGSLATMTITHSTFSNNSALNNDGGGVDNLSGATLTIANSTFVDNSASYGGGVQNINSTLTLLNSTFSGNSAASGTGAAVGTWNNAAIPSTTIYNTILANSVIGVDCWNHATGVLIGTNNIIETTGSGSNSCSTIAVYTADPMLGSLRGSPAYFPLNFGSPAIDAGDDTVCAASPVNNHDQRGVTRPFGAHCDIGSYEQNKGSLTFRSVGTNDGWILESAENSNAGGTLDKTATNFFLGDGAQDKQYRAILHFNTSSLHDNAVITKVTLKIKKQGLSGTNPFTILGGLKVDMRKPYFGTAAGLVIGDFEAAAGKSAVATFGATPVSNWYSALLNATGKAYVNKTGTTQFRLYFATGDNDDMAADYMKFYSGDYATASARPTLIIEYYVP